MANIKLIAEVVKRRARRVFLAVDNGSPFDSIRQHKLRIVTKKKLYYHWRAHRDPSKRRCTPAGFNAFLEVRRDCLNRLYIKEVQELPTKEDTVSE